MKLLLGFAGFAAIGALAAAHAFSGSAQAGSGGTVVETTQGPMIARYSPLKPDPRLPTFRRVARDVDAGGRSRFSGMPDMQEGHEARDAVRSDAVAAIDALVSVDPCDPIRREAYLAAMRRYIAAHLADKSDLDGVQPSGRWSTAADAKVGGSLSEFQEQGVISDGDMQRAMLGSTWQGKLMLMFNPPPRSAEARTRCPAPI